MPNTPAKKTTPPPCFACGTTLRRHAKYNGGWAVWDCSQCGTWGATDFLLDEDTRPKLTIDELRRLRHLFFEHKIKGGKAPILSPDPISDGAKGVWFITKDEFLSRYPKRPLEYFDRALENLGRYIPHPTASGVLEPSMHAALFSDDEGVENMITQLEGLGYIETDNGDAHEDPRTYTITPAGWARIQELETPGRDASQAFVAMWFDPAHTEYYEKAFKPAIEADGRMKAMRIDRKDHNNKIDDEIVAEIRRSRFLVADFTKHRGGVYFEAGFAVGLGLPVIWCCHEGHIAEAHFDTRQYNHITYSSPEDLRVKLLNRIRATIP